jgi:hypothetical protein
MKNYMVIAVFAMLLFSMAYMVLAEENNNTQNDSDDGSPIMRNYSTNIETADDDNETDDDSDDDNETEDDSRDKNESKWKTQLKERERIKLINRLNNKYRTNFTTSDIGTGEFKFEVKEAIRQNEREHNNKTLWLNVSGKNMTIRELDDDELEIITEKINAKTGLNLSVEDINNITTLKTLLSNGRWAEVKIMPNKISERALEILGAKCEERNCTIELKEVGIGNKTQLAYELSTEKNSKVLLLFKKKMSLVAQVDAETGQVISAKKPWWAFLAKED